MSLTACWVRQGRLMIMGWRKLRVFLGGRRGLLDLMRLMSFLGGYACLPALRRALGGSLPVMLPVVYSILMAFYLRSGVYSTASHPAGLIPRRESMPLVVFLTLRPSISICPRRLVILLACGIPNFDVLVVAEEDVPRGLLEVGDAVDGNRRLYDECD